MGEFSVLNVALAGLRAQRHALDVTGHNVANANTDGYSRQRVRFSPAGGAVAATIHSGVVRFGGVAVAEVQRLRDAFLEARGLQEHGADAALRRTQVVLSRVELALAEPGDSGIQAQMAAFWSAWDDLANRPGDRATRSQVVEQARTLAATFDQVASALASLRESTVEQLQAAVTRVNATAARVAELNQAIASATNAGMAPNDLLDQRDRLVSELAGDAAVTVRGGEANQVDVFVGGTALVRGSAAAPLAVSIGPGGVSVHRAADGLPVVVAGGEVGALVGAANDVIPRQAAALDAVAAQLVAAVNGQHQSGRDLDGNAGGPLFTGTGAGDLAVSAAVAADPRRLAAAGTGGGVLDGANALAMAELSSLPGGPDAAYRAFVNALGVEAQRVNRQVDIQSEITRQLDAARLAASSVDLDEEMTNMVAFQHAYEASARVVTVVDSMLDTLINRTGVTR